MVESKEERMENLKTALMALRSGVGIRIAIELHIST